MSKSTNVFAFIASLSAAVTIGLLQSSDAVTDESDSPTAVNTVSRSASSSIPADISRKLGDGLEAQRMLVQTDSLIRRTPIYTFDDLPELLEQASEAYRILAKYDIEELRPGLRGQGNLAQYLGSEQFHQDLRTVESLSQYVVEQSALLKDQPIDWFKRDRGQAKGVSLSSIDRSNPNLIVCNQFDVNAELSGSTLTISLDTDLPDWAALIVTVSRSYKEVGSSSIYSMDYYSGKGTVGRWRSPQQIELDAAKWRRSLRAYQREMSELDLGFEVDRIDESVTVSMVLHLRQPDRRFGTDNKNLVGKLVQSRQSRTISGEQSVHFPLTERSTTRARTTVPAPRPPAEKKEPFSKGTEYALDREGATFEVSQFEPSHSLSSIRQVRKALPFSRIRIVETVVHEDQTWLNVHCSLEYGQVLWTGWIQRDRLPQELKEQKSTDTVPSKSPFSF